MKKGLKLFCVLLAAMLLLAACGGNDSQDASPSPSPSTNDGAQTNEGNAEQQQPAEETNEPVTLNFFYNGFSESLTEEVKNMIEAEFPHVTINMILHGQGQTINDVIVSGTPVDLAAFTMGQLFNVMDLQLASDLTPLIEKHNFDVNTLADGVLETVKGYSENGEILVMPYELNNGVLLYNKNIFDRFGVEYPVDNMTWEDVHHIVEQVSREDDGVVYQGFQLFGSNPVYRNQLGLQFVDPETNKAVVNTDQWQKWLQVMTSFYSVPNNEMTGTNFETLFFQEMTLAMRTGPNPLDKLPAAMESGLEWDAVSMPVFDESTGSQMNAPFYIIPPTSRDKDTAFKVIAYLMSEEVQSWNARQGRVPIIKSETVIGQFGADLPFLEGTNYAKAIFMEKIADPIRVTKYDGIVRSEMARAIPKVAMEGLDINTVLREIEENANKLIEEAMK